MEEVSCAVGETTAGLDAFEAEADGRVVGVELLAVGTGFLAARFAHDLATASHISM